MTGATRTDKSDWYLRCRVGTRGDGRLVPGFELFNSRTRETIRIRADAAAGTTRVAGIAISLPQLSKALEGIYYSVRAEDDGE